LDFWLTYFSLDVESRIHVVKSYPIRSKSGETILIYGHESGLTVVWQDPESLEFVKDAAVHIQLGCSVVDVATPQVPSETRLQLSNIPEDLNDNVLIIAACSDFSIRAILIPLQPSEHSVPAISDVVIGSTYLPWLPTSVSLTWSVSPRNQGDTFIADEEEYSELDLTETEWLVVSSSSEGVSKAIITKFKSSQPNSFTTVQKLLLPHTPLQVSWNPSTYPSPFHSQILIPCSNGQLYIYDLSASKWVSSFVTRFEQSQSFDDASYILPRRKRILDAQWVLNGRAVIVLLSDGEWGIWDVSTNLKPNSFAIWGMIGSGIPSHFNSKTLESRSSLPTMTPNTKRVHQEHLFSGQNVHTSSTQRGAISVKPIPLPSADNSEDSVVIWYNETVCYIDSLQSYWSRAAKRSSDSKVQTTGGSLFGPGLTRMESINLQGQVVKSITQVVGQNDPGSTAPRAVVLGTQHQLVTCPYGLHRSNNPTKSSRSRSSQRNELSQSLLLKQGELGIDALDNMLDTMNSNRRHAPVDTIMSIDQDDVFMTGAVSAPSRRT
jgi:hypothetical protein